MRISFHGADRGVTGSCHLVEVGGTRILVDCGLFQGSRELEEDNADPFGFEPADIDLVLLTHAHLDHCGRLPLLSARDFRGQIVATTATRDLAALILKDAAHLQEEEARYRAQRARHHRHTPVEIEPLYTGADVDRTLQLFHTKARYGHRIQLAKGAHATFLDAGHILGSACVLLELEEGRKRKRVLFSGDLGSSGRPILRDPAEAPWADVVVMETTYGDRAHKALAPSVAELYEAINHTFAHGGNVLIPTFALERAQELLFFLREGVAEGRLPDRMQVFLDSPMAISATEIFERHPECYNAETSELFQEGRNPFHLAGLHMSRTAEESMAINQIVSGAIIMAGSGMCSGGRIRHHLRKCLWRRQCSVIFVGYAARGTLARRIIDGAEVVRIHGEEVPVRANVHTIGGFSAHADQAELLAWHRQTGDPERTFLVHGEPNVMKHFGSLLEGTTVEMPELHQGFDL
jgi:metallo-beta-lactamase family protein